jgi:hypothetical protein
LTASATFGGAWARHTPPAASALTRPAPASDRSAPCTLRRAG